MTDLLTEIKKRGYWRVTRRPSEYNEHRIQQLAELETAVRECTVSLRGWNFPQHDDSRLGYTRLADSTGQELDWNGHREIWRAYKSGQFVAVFAIWEEWRDQDKMIPPASSWVPGTSLGVEDAIFTFTEIFEFAANYSRKAAGGEKMLIKIELKGLSKRQLTLAPTKVGFAFKRVSLVDEWRWEERLERAELQAKTRSLALKPAIDLFEKFNWDVKDEVRNRATDLN